ncbi:hypothetical protein DIS24_g12194 [Lasiodiplodia hormozganensis]|uniref:Uncharacterized protein n=1 Tax=Lasiodiplodia hormozganensis TaxID=869390 RepID=A0AA39W9P0_9PEZI|nr:hypothetical protein DIS24_g12194 [Lasiodiplodia hormozganensis]
MEASPSSGEKQPLSTVNTEKPTELPTQPLSTEQLWPPPPSIADSSSALKSDQSASSAVLERSSSSPVKASINSVPLVASPTASPEEQESIPFSPTETSIHQKVQQSSILTSDISAGGSSANRPLSITETHIRSAPSGSPLEVPSTSSPLATGIAAGEAAAGETVPPTTASLTGAGIVVVGPATLSQVLNANSSPNAAGSDQASNVDSLTATLPDSTIAAEGVVVAIGGQTLSSAGQTATLSGSNDASNDASGANEQATGTADGAKQQQQPTLAILQTDSAGHTQLVVGDSTVVSDVARAYATGARTAAAVDGVLAAAATSAAFTSATDAVQGQGQGQGQGTTTTNGRQTVEAANSAGASEVETSASSASGGQTVQNDDDVGGRK